MNAFWAWVYIKKRLVMIKRNGLGFEFEAYRESFDGGNQKQHFPV